MSELGVQRILVLSAFPAECDAVLSHTTLDPNPVVVAGRRHFYLGAISGQKVIVAMTGIGLVNATNATEAAFARFDCIRAVVFSGVAGGGSRPKIGDVAVPAQWTLDSGTTFRPVDRRACWRRLRRFLSHWKAASWGANRNWSSAVTAPAATTTTARRSRLSRSAAVFLAASPAARRIGQCSSPATSFRRRGPWLAKGLIGNLTYRTAGSGVRRDGHGNGGRPGRRRCARRPIPWHPRHFGRAG